MNLSKDIFQFFQLLLNTSDISSQWDFGSIPFSFAVLCIFKPCSSTPVMKMTSSPTSLLYLDMESQIIVVYTLPK